MIRASGNPCGRCRSDASVRAIESPGGTGCDVALGTGGCADLAASSIVVDPVGEKCMRLSGRNSSILDVATTIDVDKSTANFSSRAPR